MRALESFDSVDRPALNAVSFVERCFTFVLLSKKQRRNTKGVDDAYDEMRC